MAADDELTAILNRRQDMNDGLPVQKKLSNPKLSVYTEFSEFSRKQIKDYEAKFKS